MVNKIIAGFLLVTFGFADMLNAGIYKKRILLILQFVRVHSTCWLQPLRLLTLRKR
jgi:hypothetical protein